MRLAWLFALVLLTAAGVVKTEAAQQIVYADAAAVKQKIAADRGHVVLVNFWATWCAPCVAEYPELVRLDQAYRSKGLDVITVSLDLQEDIEGKVKPFVTKQNAAFPQFVLKVDDPETAIDAFDTSWQGDLPRTFVYSRSGRLIKILPDQQTYAGFVHAVKLGFTDRST